MVKELKIIFNDFDCYKHIRSGLGSFIKEAVPKDAILVEVVLNEAVNNAIKHGKSKNVEVKLKIQKNGKLIIRVKDKGHGFPVDETIKKVTITNTKEETDYSFLKESGRGLFIMQHVMDKVVYNEFGNEVLLVKNPIS